MQQGSGRSLMAAPAQRLSEFWWCASTLPSPFPSALVHPPGLKYKLACGSVVFKFSSPYVVRAAAVLSLPLVLLLLQGCGAVAPLRDCGWRPFYAAWSYRSPHVPLVSLRPLFAGVLRAGAKRRCACGGAAGHKGGC